MEYLGYIIIVLIPLIYFVKRNANKEWVELKLEDKNLKQLQEILLSFQRNGIRCILGRKASIFGSYVEVYSGQDTRDVKLLISKEEFDKAKQLLLEKS
ncbi:hypothetical protein [Ammoniphilus sp. CFH 90114]|uniref:hypothetical protein n=1 Tax=Ammoniphilus sp. CFH 90114 TaxID=2493665 RepID=UPI00100F96A3|nr:hypothetical protein [Ammoniphilus sp. CFH 90114]RXT01937.1 hypothetical protein EIZ39_25195 [Ammoniphilus sp. CFH 90114]